ncbi:hypothetical protein [Lentibacillus sp. CBA3610]|uniref:hypothetical protein n=1 Tax=Lentibacillus sp. CBA3610 TaxID=2518176 RepID=UPI0015962640|nr:hypothetical protein [Lentibacillus sp. CBA3610]QKY71417.1 hypothetical protein Len3610_19390 [Lentibacillus sp. CBA3610]
MASFKSTSASDQDENKEEQEESINVDEGLLDAEITIPPSLLEGEDKEEVIDEAEEAGVSEVAENDDGSLTYKMSKSTHNDMMVKLKENVNQTIEEIKNDGEYISIEDIMANDSFSEFTMVVNQEKFENSFDGFAAMGLAISGLYYQLFDGVDPDNYEVTINMENTDTGEVFDSVVYPDAIEEMEEQ